MPKDRSLFHYGKPYHRFIDPLMLPARERIVAFVPEGRTVLDIGCGTGELCFELHDQKQCEVTGVDLSLKMIEFARRNNPFGKVHFMHQDATALTDFEDNRFDFAVIAFLIHELFLEDQLLAVKEAWRVARQVILVDSNAPLPWNAVGIFKRFIETAIGFEHFPQFRRYLSSGGIGHILQHAGLDARVTHQEVFSQRCNHLVVITQRIDFLETP